MGCVTRILSVLAGVCIIIAGFLVASSGFLGGGRPEFGIPIMLIGAGLFLFNVVVGILGTKRPTAVETFVITTGAILLAIGVERINVQVHYPPFSASPIIICAAGAFAVSFHRLIPSWVRSAVGFLKPRSSGK